MIKNCDFFLLNMHALRVQKINNMHLEKKRDAFAAGFDTRV